MTTITFPSPVASTTGRTLSSTITAQELGDGTRIELQVDTSHSKGSGYRSHLVRQHADGVPAGVDRGIRRSGVR